MTKLRVDKNAINKVLAGDVNALPEVFLWGDSSEGHDYWNKIHVSGKLTVKAMKKLQAYLTPTKSLRGFASMSPERQREIARKGGKAVPAEKRSFSQNPDLASRAGQIGGKACPAALRSFSTNKKLAQAAGRLGGLAVHKKKEQNENTSN